MDSIMNTFDGQKFSSANFLLLESELTGALRNTRCCPASIKSIEDVIIFLITSPMFFDQRSLTSEKLINAAH